MTARSLRRAAERQANQLMRKAQISPQQTTDPADPAGISPRTLANRANALHSTGPKSFEGKTKVSLNAVKTALTGRTVLLPTDDAAEYQQYLTEYSGECQPVGVRERDLVQSIADTMWRLRRLPGLEMAVFTQGCVEFADLFDAYDPSLRRSMIEFHTMIQYEKELRNLRLQEARLQRRREKETAELTELQKQRKASEAGRKQQALDAEAQRYIVAKHHNRPFQPVINGFDFSIADIEAYLGRVSSAWFQKIDETLAGTAERAA